MFVSDPSQQAAPRVTSTSWFTALLRASLVRRDNKAPAPRRPTQRVLAYALVSATGVYVALYSIATLLSTPLVTPSAASPAFPIEVTSTGGGPVTVLAYGREVGVHLLRVPSAASGDPARVIPARLADAELQVISLGWSSLSLRSTGPFGPVVSLSAQARALTIYHTPALTGVRTGW